MRSLGVIILFLALSVVLAHSVFPHHHHQPELASQSEADHHDHEGSNVHHHDEDHSDDHHHGLFTDSQIDHAFLTSKQVVVPMAVTPVIKIFHWSFIICYNQVPDNFYRKDVELPPLIRCQEISFRGPPII